MGRPVTQPFASAIRGEYLLMINQIASSHDRCHLRGFFGYACHKGIEVAALTDQHLHAYCEESEVRQRIKRYTQFRRDIANAWNRALAIHGWPARRLTLEQPLKPRSLPFEAFPPSFEVEARAYLDHEPLGVGLFDATGHGGFAPATRIDRARKIRLLASIAVHCGLPVGSLCGLSDLLNAAKLVLEYVWQAHGYKPNGHAANLARTLLAIANHLHAAPTLIEQLKSAHNKMRPKTSGMAEQNYKKLRVFTDEASLRRLLQLPHAILSSLNITKPTISDALHLQSALAIAILLTAPMREKNLAHLSTSHIDRGSYIVIPKDEVKNDQTLHYPLPQRLRDMLKLYLDFYHPLLARGSETPYLFISMNGKLKTPAQIGAQVTMFVRNHIGLTINTHLFRHLAGYIFLREHPGEYETVRQLLGHKSINTTIRFYTGLEIETSFSRYDAVLDKLGSTEAGDASA